ncbi:MULTISPECIES: alpha/beta hydrolase family protein [unclassified Caulobacter]|uniref:alpha/beta hydrolase family protein n=1 Tax=unclassified Caulobacter TaxID=2648921 RepID=UPI0018EE802B|nr:MULTISPECIES: alpha/beta hydrolase [unclassified Caulobacter]
MRLACLAAAVALIAAGPAAAAPKTFRQLLDMPRAAPTAHIPYGSEPEQFGDLWLPEGTGKHPVVVLIHGGCWLAEYPSVELMAYMARDLQGRGYAVWNLAYRRLGEPGGGYPGTFVDVAQGLDKLRELAPAHNLDLRRVVVAGHSAGGHLTSWAAARPRLPRTSPLRVGKPLKIRGAISLAGINDLAAYRATGPDACGGPETIDRLTAGAALPDRYADTSPPALLPIRTPLAVISGALDPIVPPAFGADFAARAKAAGDRVEEITIADAGHFELIDPTSAAWPRIVAVIDRMAGK